MAKVTTVDKMKNLFATADDQWVCPVTGKKFNRSDVKEIEEHKAEVIRNLEIKNEAARKTKVTNSLRAEGEKLSTLTDFRKWMAKRIQVLIGVEVKVDEISVTTIQQKHTDIRFDEARLRVSLQGLVNDISPADLKKLGFTNAGKNSGTFELPVSPLQKSLGQLARKKIASSLTVEQMGQLRESDPVYVGNVSRLKELRETISSLRDQIKDLESTNAEIRESYLANSDNYLATLG